MAAGDLIASTVAGLPWLAVMLAMTLITYNKQATHSMTEKPRYNVAGQVWKRGTSQLTRMILFYGVCVIVRSAIGSVMLFANYQWQVITIAVLGFVSGIGFWGKAYYAPRMSVWWSRVAAGFSLVLVGIMATLTASGVLPNTWAAGSVVLAWTVASMFATFFVMPFEWAGVYKSQNKYTAHSTHKAARR